jgi:hypothetical protein
VSDPGFEPRTFGDEVKLSPPLGQKNLNDFCRSRKIYKREKPCDVSAFFQLIEHGDSDYVISKSALEVCEYTKQSE